MHLFVFLNTFFLKKIICVLISYLVPALMHRNIFTALWHSKVFTVLNSEDKLQEIACIYTEKNDNFF